MVIEIVDLPIKNGDVLYSYVSLPEGDHNLWIIYVFVSMVLNRGFNMV